jgi:hypothetical protein
MLPIGKSAQIVTWCRKKGELGGRRKQKSRYMAA